MAGPRALAMDGSLVAQVSSPRPIIPALCPLPVPVPPGETLSLCRPEPLLFFEVTQLLQSFLQNPLVPNHLFITSFIRNGSGMGKGELLINGHFVLC